MLEKSLKMALNSKLKPVAGAFLILSVLLSSLASSKWQPVAASKAINPIASMTKRAASVKSGVLIASVQYNEQFDQQLADESGGHGSNKMSFIASAHLTRAVTIKNEDGIIEISADEKGEKTQTGTAAFSQEFHASGKDFSTTGTQVFNATLGNNSPDIASVSQSAAGADFSIGVNMSAEMKGSCHFISSLGGSSNACDGNAFTSGVKLPSGEYTEATLNLGATIKPDSEADSPEIVAFKSNSDVWFVSEFWVGAKTAKMANDEYHVSFSGSKSMSKEGINATKNITVNITIRPGAPVPAEMEIAPVDVQGYNDWLPLPAEPSAADKQIYGAGSALIFNAFIKPKDKNKPPPKGRIDFYLQDVSRHKGISTNYPKNASEKDDLKFAAVQPANVTVDPNNPKHAYTTDEVTNAAVSVEATDTAAYGKLTARADSLGLQAVYKRTGANSIQIPRDDNDNHVADKWEQDEEVFSKHYAAKWDEDSYPQGQRRNGDGYTLYEEYRGFVVLKDSRELQKIFVRTSPNKKDIFIYDRDGLIKKYYEPYNPAQLQLHYIDNTLMEFNADGLDPTNRWVNVNSSTNDWYARQYAMYVYTENKTDESGGSNDIQLLKNMPDSYDAFAAPLKNFYEMAISPAGVRSQYPTPPFTLQEQQAAFEADMITTVIHEFGHYVGISHHRLSGVESDASQRGGVLDCPMRYYNQNDLNEFQKMRILKPRINYCRVGQAGVKIKTVQNGFETFMEKGVKKQRTHFDYFIDPSGTVPSDDCFHKIDVKSDS